MPDSTPESHLVLKLLSLFFVRLFRQLGRRDRAARLKFFENMLGQLVIRSQFGSLGKVLFGLLFGCGHQVVVAQQELAGGRLGNVNHGLFQLAKLIRVLVGVVVIGIQVIPVAGRAQDQGGMGLGRGAQIVAGGK